MIDLPEPPRYLKHGFLIAFIFVVIFAYFLIDISRNTVIELIKFVALALPAAAIYLQIFAGYLESTGDDNATDLELQVHQIRLVFIFLAVSGMLLLSALLFLEFNISHWLLQLTVDIFVILSIIAIIGTLGMFGLSMAYWPRALETRNSIWFGIQQPLLNISSISHWSNIKQALEILNNEGNLSEDHLYNKSSTYFTGEDYQRQVKEWALEYELISITDEGQIEITERGKDLLEGNITVDEILVEER